MRYISVDKIDYITPSGETIRVRDLREIENMTFWFSVKVKEGDTLDEIASRREVYSEGGESLSYRIFDFNRVKLVEYQFNVGSLGKVDIPV